MKLAILGCDDEVLRLARHVAGDPSHDIVAVCASANWRERLKPFLSHAVWRDDWESLIATSEVDAVVMGRDRSTFDGPDSLKKLVQAAMPLLVTHPVGDPLLALELDMIRVERQGPIVVQFPGCRHPGLKRLREWMVAGEQAPIGIVEQMVFERGLPERDRASVTFQLTRDAEVIRSLLGNITKVSAMGPSADSETWSNLSVQLAGNGDVLARWSVEPSAGSTHARLTLIGTSGRATLLMPADDANWSLDVVPHPRENASWPGWSAPAAALAALDDARRGIDVVPDWPAVCRDLEVADTVELSLRRGRMIELHHESVTEEDTFKGVMSALGCLLLLVIPLVLVAAAVFDGVRSTQRGSSSTIASSDIASSESTDLPGALSPNTRANAEDPRETAATPQDERRLGELGAGGGAQAADPAAPRRLWPYLIVAPLLAFLALQLLRLVFAGRRRSPVKT